MNIILQLNEINFDLVKHYIKSGKSLPNFSKLVKEYRSSNTSSETDYNKLEPWIQWVSFYTGKSFEEHKIFRLGDAVKTKVNDQIFCEIESMGLKVGAVSPMNARNDLINPSYFIPDPWTKTSCDNTTFSKRITNMLVQTVNDNTSGKISFKSILTLIEIIIKTFSIKDYFYFLYLVIITLRKKWYKSLILDFIIHKLHLFYYRSKSPDISFVFLNAGAHIQHHYMFNSSYYNGNLKNPNWYISEKHDPVSDMLEIYDKLIGDFIHLKCSLFVITGLSQEPYGNKKFYWRLKDHTNFFNELDLNFIKINPRMTRDFEVLFESNKDRDKFQREIENLYLNESCEKLFGEIQVREQSLFITLTYPNEITQSDIISLKHKKLYLYNHVNFVAIKNGMHSGRGYFYYPNDFPAPQNSDFNIKDLRKLFLDYFAKKK